jgi:hypothetical protein
MRRLLLIFLRRSVYHGEMNHDHAREDRPDIVAAIRGGDNSLGMDDEADPAAAHWNKRCSGETSMPRSWPWKRRSSSGCTSSWRVNHPKHEERLS